MTPGLLALALLPADAPVRRNVEPAAGTPPAMAPANPGVLIFAPAASAPEHVARTDVE